MNRDSRRDSASMSDTARRTFRRPRRVLSPEWIAELRANVNARDDIAAVYWVTAVYAFEGGESPIAQDELHFELVQPPEVFAGREKFNATGAMLPRGAPFSEEGLIFTIPTSATLPAVREAALRLV